MLLHKEKRIALLYNPKTGSASLHNLLKNLDADLNSHTHEKSISEPNDYTFYCFYRDPVERYVSAFNHVLASTRGEIHKRRDPSAVVKYLLGHFYGEEFSCASVATYEDLTETQKNKIDSITPIQFLDTLGQNRSTIFQSQKEWFQNPNTVFLDFRNFDNEARKICRLFDLEPSKIPRENLGIKLHKRTDLSEADVLKIKEFYREDYDFFNSKGITFS
jgi:hypothetical protein